MKNNTLVVIFVFNSLFQLEIEKKMLNLIYLFQL